MTHRDIVAWGFRAGAFVLGAPSLAGLALVGYSLLTGRAPQGGKSEALDIGTYGIAGLLANGARGVAGVFDWLGGIATWAATLLAAVLGALLVFALILYFTGRGIARHAPSAGAIGIGLSVIFLLFWAVVLLSLNRTPAMAVPVIGLAMAGYAVWVLGWR